VVEACRLAREGRVDGIVTAPLNKAAMQAGGHKWPGHTELLAHEFGVQNFSLVLSAGDLYLFHLTAHVSLQQAIANCTPEPADDVLTLAGAFVRGWDKGICRDWAVSVNAPLASASHGRLQYVGVFIAKDSVLAGVRV
jgi:4-phospho-D-threonate 3-dehydrogenase / 4-phospho-D-erythronate 3-dehydrogenase